MIERLHGILAERHPTFAVVECGGVGYGVQVSARTGERLPAEGSEITLLTHLVVREDSMELFGFADAKEKELFLSMISVSGVGPKTAQRILSGISPEDFLAIIARGDKTALGKIKGVGKKTAEMFVLNLKDKALELSAVSGSETPAPLSASESEAVQALHTLGVKDPAAQKAVEKAVEALGQGASVTQLIPEALKHV